jgi:hypothetical protein
MRNECYGYAPIHSRESRPRMDDQRTDSAGSGISYRKLLLALLVGWLIGLFSYSVSLRGDKSFSWAEFSYVVFFVGSVLGILLAFCYWLKRIGLYLMIRTCEASSKNDGPEK